VSLTDKKSFELWCFHIPLHSNDFVFQSMLMYFSNSNIFCALQLLIILRHTFRCQTEMWLLLLFSAFLQDRKVLTFTLWHVLVNILCKSEGDSFVQTKFPGGCVGCCVVTTSNVLQRIFFVRCCPWNRSQYFHCVTSVILS